VHACSMQRATWHSRCRPCRCANCRQKQSEDGQTSMQKMVPKIDAKSPQDRSREHSGAAWSAQGTPGDDPERPRCTPGAPGEPPKKILLKEKDTFGVPWGVSKRTEAIKIDADSPPGTEKPSFFRTAGLRRPVGAFFWSVPFIFGFFVKC